MTTQFSDKQFTQAYADGMEDSYWNIARKRLILHYIKKYKLNNILDVGCGRGIVTSYLYSHGLTIIGVDLGGSSRIDKSELKIYYNTNAIELPVEIRQSIRTISLFDVIEHIEEPVAFLKSLSASFPNLTNLVITVPARQELWSNFDDYYGHFRRYTLESTKKEVRDSGFKPLYSRYFFHILYPIIRMNNILVKKREINFSPPRGSMSRFVNKLMAAAFYPENFIIPASVLGSSILCICGKTPQPETK